MMKPIRRLDDKRIRTDVFVKESAVIPSRFERSSCGRFWIDLLTGENIPVIAGGVNMFTPHLRRFRFYDDSGGEAGSSQLAAEDTNISVDVTSGDVDIQYRVLIEETGNAAGSTMDDWTVQTNKNGAGVVDLSATDPGSGIHGTNAGLTNDAATTDRGTDPISNPGAGSFVAGEQSNDGVVDDMELTALNFTEHVWGIRLVSANLADADAFVVDLRTPASIVVDIQATITIIKTGGGLNIPVAVNSYRQRRQPMAT